MASHHAPKMALLLVVSLCLSPIGVSPTAARADQPSPQRWAILAADARSRPLTDLLTASLSSDQSLRLLERERIREVLDELRLSASGLVEQNKTLRFGELLQADALVLVSTTEDQWSKKTLFRTRLIDTRTSIRLLDLVVAPSEIENQMDSITSELSGLRGKLSVPKNQLRLISISRIVSGEPGHHLRPLCRTLNILAASSFQRQADLVVLEREDLDRLVRESDLSGLELELRTATRLLEVSVTRTSGNQGIEARCRLARLDGQSKPKTFVIRVDSQDPDSIRTELVSGVVKHLELENPSASSSQGESEAKFFSQRAQQFYGAYRFYEAAEFGYTAFVLAPTKDRLDDALRFHSSAIRQHLKEDQRTEALLLTQRVEEIRLRLEQEQPSRLRSFPFDPTLFSRVAPPLRDGGSSAANPQTREQIAIFSDIIATKQNLLRLRMKRALGDPQREAEYQQGLLQLEMRRLDSPRVRPVTEMLRSMFRQRAARNLPMSIEDASYRSLVGQLISVAKKVCDDARRPLWKTDRHLWARELTSLDQRFGRAAQLMMKTRQPTREAEPAARELIKLLADSPEHTNLIPGLDSSLRRFALARLPIDDRWQYLEELVERCEERGDFIELLWHSSSIPYALISLRRVSQERASQLAGRIDAILPKRPTNQSAYIIRRDEWAAHQERQRAYALRNSLLTHLPVQRVKPYQKGLSLDGAPGPWNQFVARPIQIESEDRYFQVSEIYVDRRDDARRRGGELILVRTRPKGKLSIDRVRANGGSLTKIGPDVPGSSVAFRGVQVTVGDDAIYVASQHPGFIRLTPNGFQEFNESNGAAANDVWKLTWFDKKLYVAYADAFGVFDPSTEQFQLLASSTSVEAANPIDARGSFFIRTLMPDPRHRCLWITIQDNALPRDRNGFWKFTPQDSHFEKLSGGHVRISPSGTGLLVNRSVEPKIAWFDPDSNQFHGLPSLLGASRSQSFPTHLIKVDDFLIDEYGRLIAEDGTVHSVPGKHRWNHLQHFDKGFITHYDEKARVIWYIEPKPAAGSR